MNSKPTENPAVGQPVEMSDPTRYILRCVELRKRKAAENKLLTTRLRTQAGATTQR
jgi:hypothetical protein